MWENMMFPLAIYGDNDDDDDVAASHWGNMDIYTVIYTVLHYYHELLFLARANLLTSQLRHVTLSHAVYNRTKIWLFCISH